MKPTHTKVRPHQNSRYKINDLRIKPKNLLKNDSLDI